VTAIAIGTRIKLEMPPCKCGYPARWPLQIGPHNGTAFPLLCPGCGARRAQVSNSTAATIGKIANLFGAPQTIALRRSQIISCERTDNPPTSAN
jgi:hypothetical protein